MNTGTARIAIIVALVVVGVLVLTNGFADIGTAADESAVDSPTPGPTNSPSPADTEAPKPPEETPSPSAPKDTSVAVFNGTSSIGLAGTVMEDLIAGGYVQGQVPTDALNRPVERTIVYYVGGADAEQNASDATQIADTSFKGAKVKELDPQYNDNDLVAKDVQVVVVVGLNDVPPAG